MIPARLKNQQHLKGIWALSTVVLAIAFMAVGLMTRFPAIALGQYYGLHALLAAPFFSCIAAFYLTRWNAVLPPSVALALCGCFLCMMQPAMGISWIVSDAAMTIGVLLCTKKSDVRALLGGTLLGASFYPITLSVGVLSASLIFVPETQGLVTLLFILLGCALSFIGSLAGSWLGERGFKSDN